MGEQRVDLGEAVGDDPVGPSPPDPPDHPPVGSPEGGHHCQIPWTGGGAGGSGGGVGVQEEQRAPLSGQGQEGHSPQGAGGQAADGGPHPLMLPMHLALIPGQGGEGGSQMGGMRGGME